MKLASAI